MTLWRIGWLLTFLAGWPQGSTAGIHEAKAVAIGGIQQWIDIRGDDECNPVLLYLHGGPGNVATPYADRFTRTLQKYFVVVFWDQRASGRTAKMNPVPSGLTVKRFDDDAADVIRYLRDRLHCEKIFLAGHSWGGYLALRVAAHHPEWLYGCFAIAPMVNQNESERMSLEAMKQLANEKKILQAQAELATVHIPFEDGNQLYFHRAWLNILIDGHKPSASQPYVVQWARTCLVLFNEGAAENLAVTMPEIRCPVFFLLGRKDHQTNYKITEAYFKELKAEKKELFWFDQSGHSLNLSEPKKFQEVIISTAKTIL